MIGLRILTNGSGILTINYTMLTIMDTIIRNYDQRKKALISTLLHKFCIDESRREVVLKQLDTIIDHTLHPFDPAIAIKRNKREAYLEIGSVVRDLKKEIAALRHTNALIVSEIPCHGLSTEFDAEFVNKINQHILANSMRKNDFRELILSHTTPSSRTLTDDNFSKALVVVSAFTNVDQKLITGKCRKTPIYSARRLLIISILCFYKTTLVKLGKLLKKDHSSILHYIDASKKINYDNKEKKKGSLQV